MYFLEYSNRLTDLIIKFLNTSFLLDLLAMEKNIAKIISDTISELFDMLGQGEAGVCITPASEIKGYT